jgi:hypothetical protein
VQVEGLGEKIGGELAAVNVRMEEMQREVEGWSKVEEAQGKAKATVLELTERREELMGKRDAVKVGQVGGGSMWWWSDMPWVW